MEAGRLGRKLGSGTGEHGNGDESFLHDKNVTSKDFG